MTRRLAILIALSVVAIAPLAVQGSPSKHTPKPPRQRARAAGARARGKGTDRLARIKHIIVIYEENHSFDNLYGGWEGVNGRQNADAAHTTQVDQNGTPYSCLKQLDVNLTSPPLPGDCTDAAHSITSHFKNTWFTIDDFIPASAKTCPSPQQAFDLAFNPASRFLNGIPAPTGLPGGCTRDLWHEYYQGQYQLNHGAQNRYMTGSNAAGLTMGIYDTTLLPIYRYLHSNGHPPYAIADAFFQGAFGGSFLNHQWLIAAATPTFPGAPAELHAIIDANGMPAGPPLAPLYTPTGLVRRAPLTVACPAPASAPNGVCGNYVVTSMQPPFEPFQPFPPPGSPGSSIQQIPQLTVPQTNPTIGDRLTAKGVDWAWYSGGWSNANGNVGGPGWTNGTTLGTCTDPDTIPGAVYPNCANAVFQFHHQPFNYYAPFTTATPAGWANRTAHLRDEVEFMSLGKNSRARCQLRPVSFVKPLGQENEHPGYASEWTGNDHLVDDLLKPIEQSACATDTMVIVTYDEFGGQWDHVSPPGQGNNNGPHDAWGPSTRVPALVISPYLRATAVVDHTEHDTTSILATIEHRWDLQPLSSRDAAVPDLSSVFDAHRLMGKE
jgi:acid phosphatase